MKPHLCPSPVFTQFPSTSKRHISPALTLFSPVFLKFRSISNQQKMSSNSSTPQTSKPHLELSWPHLDNNTSTGGCWDFLETTTNTSHCFCFRQTTTKPSTFLLSTRGLELGSESGSCIDPSLDMCPYTTRERQYSSKIKPRKTREICKKTKHITNFPPPLTSISSGYGVKVQAQRGGGQLLITAVISSTACRVYLKSERENGRLRVFLHKDYYWRSEQRLAEKIKENGAKIRSNFKCGDASGSKNLTSLPLCLV